MSLGGAFTNSVGALLAQSDAMGVISQNIANVNTTGYKSSTDNFQTALSEVTDGGQTQIFGAKTDLVKNITQQGPIQTTGLWDNLAISGRGFFIVNSAADGTGTDYYSRDGAFNSQVVNNGTTTTSVAGSTNAATNTSYLTDSNGDFLMGWKAVNGVVTPDDSTKNLVPVGYQLGSTLPGQATTNINLQAVVPSSGGISNGVLSQESAGINGPVTPNDIFKITLNDTSLPGGSVTLSYTATATDTPNTIAAALASQASSSAALQSAGIYATGSGTQVNFIPTRPDGTLSFGQSVTRPAPTETVALAAGATSNAEVVSIGGTPTPGDTANFTITNASLPGGAKTVSYTVLPTDTSATISAGLAAAVNADTDLQAAGITAGTSGGAMTVLSPAAPPATTYSQSVTATGTETMSLAAGVPSGGNSPQNVTFGGTPQTGDVVGLTITNAALPGGAETVTYTVAAGDTLSMIGAQLAGKVNTDANLSAAGITAGNSANTVTVNTPTALGTTTYAQSVTATGTETIGLAAGTAVNPQTATIAGTPLPGDVVQLTVANALLSGGSESVNYTVQTGDTLTSIGAGLTTLLNADPALKTLGITASNASGTVTINSPVANGATTYAQSVTGTPTDTVNLATSNTNTVSTGLPVYDNNFNVQTLQMNMTPIGSDTWLASFSTPAGAASTTFPLVVTFNGAGTIVSPTSTDVNVAWNDGTSSSINIDMSKVQQLASGNFQLGNTSQNGYGPATLSKVSFDSQGNLYGSYTPLPPTTAFETATIGGTPTAGDVISLNLQNASFGNATVTYTVGAGDTPASIAAGLTAAVNANASLSGLGFNAIASGNNLTISAPLSGGSTAYGTNVTGGGAETISLAASPASDSASVQQVLLYQVPVATFVSEDSLQPISGNLFEQTAAAGDMTVAPIAAGNNPLTTLIPGSVEMSNVDLGDQFTRMITTQQAYSSASHVFQTADQMMESVRDLVT